MNKNTNFSRALSLTGGLFASIVMIAVAFRLATAGVDQNELFELGDAGDPAIPGIGDILDDAAQPGPDWNELFDADRNRKDAIDEFGNPGANGVPDFLDTGGKFRGRRDAAFIADDVSAGNYLDTSAFVAPGMVGVNSVAADYDLGNAYGYLAFNATKELILYVGLERLSTSDSSLVFEFNRRVVSPGAGGEIAPQRALGDLQVTATFAGGVLTQLAVEAWALIDEPANLYGWTDLESLPINPDSSAEQCNSTRQLCAFCNGLSIDGGAWQNHDVAGNPVEQLESNTFMEFGINLTALVGIQNWGNYYNTRYASMQISSYDNGAPSTAKDYALGHFSRAANLAPYINQEAGQ